MTQEFYANPRWDVDTWVEVIGVEYERLIGAYSFDVDFRSLGSAIELLDVGCGTAIFPGYLDPTLSPDVHISVDLLDQSQVSLDRAAEVMGRLDHFTVRDTFLTRIEDLTPLDGPSYHVVWAIHSFTTVDMTLMPAAIDRLMNALHPGGYLYVYQLTAASAYQQVHDAYRASRGGDPYMEFEDTVRILDAAGHDYQVTELAFDHIVPDTPEALGEYLRKVTLDDLAPLELFDRLLADYRGQGVVRFPQTVNLIAVRGQG
jgi:SAM-dependent methyltransferase